MYGSVDYSNQYTSSTQYIPPAVPNLPPFSAYGGTPPPVHAPGFGRQPPPPGSPYPSTPPFPMGTPPGMSPHGTPRARNLSSRRVYPPASTPWRSAPAPANPLAHPLPGQALLGVSSQKPSFSAAFSIASPHAGSPHASKGTGKLEQHIPNPNAKKAKIQHFGTFMIDRIGINGNDPMSNPARHLNIIGRAVNELPLPLQVDRDGSPAVIGCFNCGGDHRISECTYRRNHQCVTMNRTLRQQVTASATKRQHFRSRYFVEQEGSSGFSPKNEKKIQSNAPPPLQLFDSEKDMPSSSKQERNKQEKRGGRSRSNDRGRGPANGRGRVSTPNSNNGQRQRQAPPSSQSAQRWVPKQQDRSSPAPQHHQQQHRGGGGGGYPQRHEHQQQQQQFQTPPPRQHRNHQQQQYRPRSTPHNQHQNHIGYGRGGGAIGGYGGGSTPNKQRVQHHTDYSYGSARAHQGYGQIQRGGSGGGGGRRNRY